MKEIKFGFRLLMWVLSMFLYIPILLFLYAALRGELYTKGLWDFLKGGISDTYYCMVLNG